MKDCSEGNKNYSAYIDNLGNSSKLTLRRALQFIDWEKYIRKDSTVFIKPNFTFPYYKKGITTSPWLIKSLLEIIRERTENIIVGESDGGNHSFGAEDSFRGHGMYEICREAGAKLVNLSSLPCRYVESIIQSQKSKSSTTSITFR